MSRHFETLRQALTVRARGQEHTFYIRELGFLQFHEIQRKAGASLKGADRGLAIMEAIALAAVEEEDGTPSYKTADEWRSEIKEVVDALSKPIMKAQGIDLDQKADPLPEAQAAGN